MALIDTLKTLLGSAWHVNSDAALAALVPAVDGTVEAGKVITADANKTVTGLNIAVSTVTAGALTVSTLTVSNVATAGSAVVVGAATVSTLTVSNVATAGSAVVTGGATVSTLTVSNAGTFGSSVTAAQALVSLSAMIGSSISSLIGFHGSTQVSQRQGVAQAAVSTAATVSNSGVFGYSTNTQADGIVTLVNEIRAALVEKGIIKGS